MSVNRPGLMLGIAILLMLNSYFYCFDPFRLDRAESFGTVIGQ